jgi:hypothetical protein
MVDIQCTNIALSVRNGNPKLSTPIMAHDFGLKHDVFNFSELKHVVMHWFSGVITIEQLVPVLVDLRAGKSREWPMLLRVFLEGVFLPLDSIVRGC